MAVSGSTQVITNQGLRNASTVGLSPGSYQLLTVDENTNNIGWENITSATTQLLGSSITINFVSGNTLVCSATQKIFKLGVGFVQANTLTTLDKVVGIDKNEIVINFTTNLLSLTVNSFITTPYNNYFGNGILLSDEN